MYDTMYCCTFIVDLKMEKFAQCKNKFYIKHDFEASLKIFLHFFLYFMTYMLFMHEDILCRFTILLIISVE